MTLFGRTPRLQPDKHLPIDSTGLGSNGTGIPTAPARVQVAPSGFQDCVLRWTALDCIRLHRSLGSQPSAAILQKQTLTISVSREPPPSAVPMSEKHIGPVLAAVAAAIALVVVQRRSRHPPYPPGPKGYPIIGNMLDFPENPIWEGFMKMAQDQGERWPLLRPAP